VVDNSVHGRALVTIDRNRITVPLLLPNESRGANGHQEFDLA
jgi:hypothetical protein